MMKNKILFILLFTAFTHAMGKNLVYDFPLEAGCKNYSPKISTLLDKIKKEAKSNDNVTLKFKKGTYIFRKEGTVQRTCFISNHDQTNPKNIVMDLSGIENLTLDGAGADFMFEGRMIPIMASGCKNLTLKWFSIDFIHPHIMQMEIIKNQGEDGIISYVAPWTTYDIDNDGHLVNCGEGWRNIPNNGIVFDSKDRHIVYGISDITIETAGSDSLENRIIESPHWKDSRLKTGQVVVARTYDRPCPGIFLEESTDSHLEYVTVHYAEGMGLLAQRCENISLEGFRVALREKNGQRYFTTQADATHFSGCKGKIISRDGLYENMMDDAINVHGTYLQIQAISEDRKKVTGKYMHDQSWGFRWGDQGDSLQFICPKTMEILQKNRITSIESDGQMKEFTITLSEAIGNDIEVGDGIENLTWYPEVEFSGNTIRNNRARGSLFSTPRKVIVDNNLFIHVSGCAILLCGDCNGWYESGSCRNVLIKNNRFIDVLTSPFQFTEAIISIYPVIPDISSQKGYFHSGIKIENNYFETFDRPILFAISVDGLNFQRNLIQVDTRYKPYHSNRYTFNFSHVTNYNVSENTLSGYKYSEKEDLLVK